MTSIEVLAQREAQAEQAKGRADKAWRTAWWETTLALGKVTGKAATGNAQRAVADTLDQSLSWVRRRTMAGRAFDSLAGIHDAPTRMAVEVVSAGIEPTAELVAEMIQAERDGIGLREFTANLTGKGWADTPEGASEETIEKIVEAQPETVARVVANNPKASEATDRAQMDKALSPHGMSLQDQGGVPDPTPRWRRMTLNIAGEIRTVLTMIGDLRDEGQVELADKALADLRDVLIDGTARCETIPDTPEGIAP